ncbi:hypothetical protein [Catellatospora sp. NPDC049609]|uniref:hypothetical protein n=1 Tax=Catellatospora sp. NPDC049609 TaxID=3155505 RepID=UPI00344316FA
MTDLRQLLSDIGDRAGHYDVTERALTVSRRNRQRRTAVGTTAAALTVVAVAGWSLWPGGGSGAGPGVNPAASASPSPSAAAAPALPASCRVDRLPLPDGLTSGAANAVDPTGRYVIGSAGVDGSAIKEHLLLWDGDEVRRLKLTGQHQRLRAVNSAGTVLAATVLNQREQSVWVYRDGKFTRLQGGEADAVDMNESGVVIGTEIIRGRNGKDGSAHPVRWRTPTSLMERLPLPPGDWPGGVTVSGIDDDGTIIMNASRGREAWHAFALRPDGTWQTLTASVTVDGLTAAAPQAVAIRGGWVTGVARLPQIAPSTQSRLVDVLWNLRTGEVGVLPRGGIAAVVNAHGWTVSWLGGPRLNSATGAQLTLPAAPEQTADFPTYLSGLSDDGRVLIGLQQLNYDPDLVPLRWRCS